MTPESGDAESSRAVVLHGTAVALGGRGLLVLGSSGAGKSGLALRLIAMGAKLVADDRVELRREGSGAAERLLARAPAPLAGLIEARGVGVLRLEPQGEVAIDLAADLDRSPSARMPQAATITLLGREVELILARDVPNIDSVLMISMRYRWSPSE